VRACSGRGALPAGGAPEAVGRVHREQGGARQAADGGIGQGALRSGWLPPALPQSCTHAWQQSCRSVVAVDSLHAHVRKLYKTPGCCTSVADNEAESARRREAATYLEALPRAQKAPPAAALEQPAERPRPSAAPAAKPAGVAQPVEAGRPGKRRGPLPLWLVELVVIAAVPGLLYALLRWEAQARGPPRGPRPQPGLVTLPYSTGHGSHHWSP